MKVTAIIAEYNPIHNGHIKHIETARLKTGADYIIAVMSGDYVQRGAPAVISKYERAKAALMAGADLVIELPFYYSCSSLEYFAKGAVSLIAKTGVVDCISFGSECGDINSLIEAAGIMHDLNRSDDPSIRKKLSGGFSFSHAINTSDDIPENIRKILSTPNNLLAAAYISAAKDFQGGFAFHTMKREGAAYHDDSSFALSSTSLRKDILNVQREQPEREISLHNVLKDRISDEILRSLLSCLDRYTAVSEDDLSLMLFARIQDILRTAACDDADPVEVLTSFLDVSKSLANRIKAAYSHAASYTALCSEIKSKDINYSRISRALLHILLDIKKDRMDEYVKDGYNYYIRPLGFKKDSSGLLHEIKHCASVPLISKAADHADILRSFYLPDAPDICSHALRMFGENTAAADLYEKTVCSLSRQPFISEYEQALPVIF